MKIEVKIPWRNPDGKNPLAICSITLDGVFVVSGLKVMDGTKGLWVAMPSAKYKDEYKDVAFPISKAFREELQQAVLAKYSEGAPQQSFEQQQTDDNLPF